MMLGDFSCVCDRCGQAEESTSVLLFVTVSDLASDGLSQEMLHFCRRNGCAGKVRTPSMIAAKLDKEKQGG